MSLFSFKLPDIGEGITESEIAAWRVAVGDRIEEDQPLVDMLTDKAAVEIPSPVAGVVRELKGAVGDKMAVGSVLLVIETSGSVAETPAAAPAPAPAARDEARSAPAAAPAVAVVRTEETASAGLPLAAPSVRKRARDLGLTLAGRQGSGKGGRILLADVEGWARPATAVAPAAAAASDSVEAIRIIGLRRKIAESMQRAKQRIPHFAYVEEVDATELEKLRVQLNEQHGKTRPKLTLLPFLMRALVKAVPSVPQVNARYDDEAGILHRHSALHVGIAAQTPGGLVVPVVRHAERLDLWQAAGEISRLAEAARAGKAKREELTGSTITISSLGRMGGIVSTPVINAPEVAILGVNKLVERPMVVNGQVVIRSMMNLSSSFDHRIVDGWDAATFVQKVKTLLETPALLFLD
ncbi:MAG TPA: dihydrolipoamide acetyltransferase family protein [Nevskiaceae bacterium]|nr:dihydrolipoamide acetyltransferase family protein [Nevskiaceae bacterium]